MKEKRKFPRIKIPLCAQYKTADIQPYGIPAVIRDISFEGVRLIVDTPREISLNPKAHLEIIFPQETLNVPMQLVWSKKHSLTQQEAGFSLINPPKKYRDLIYNYIS